MKRRDFLKLLPLAPLSGCALWRVDLYHVLLRSPFIKNAEDEQRILAKAKLGRTADGKIRVLFTRGTAYERGYQQGALLRDEIHDNIMYMYKKALRTFRSEELFAEAYERMRPWIPKDYVDEMWGMAHGAQIPLAAVHHIHVLADIGEWGGKKELGKVLKRMIAGEDFGTMCSNISASTSATPDGDLIAVRVLDWGLHKISRLHKYPLITVNVPDNGIPSANIGWVGYLGAVSGLNAAGITLGEMGYRNPPNETLDGIPMPFMLREVLTHAGSLADVRKIISEARGTNSYVFLMTDGKTKTAQFYVKDRDRFLVFNPGVEVNDDKEHLPAIADVSYGGRYNEKLTALLSANHGEITVEKLMKEIIPQVIMQSNFQNVIYLPEKLQFYVNNAASKDILAANQPYTFFDLRAALKEFAPDKVD